MLLTVAVSSMIFAVVLYTLGVFREKKEGVLKKNHVFTFWAGLVFDTTGTTAMANIKEGFTLDIHGITGLIALILMMLHVFWATWVLFKGSAAQKIGFHRYSFFVWLLWLVPFILGMMLNM